ncbi:AbiJ-NTD4 domain-containing protein [Rhizobium leguminosarum]|uniref:AbiJ-NTD4 domain-containing protein n=1 Tax=Rhizobium leguminosarum TaxID=384 RepID=UPI001D454E0F|nr:hypothetical protein [Rhizobium leguminosarum]MBP2450074.1 hypothetical protein [Rhizobium leguminosarum]
MTESTYFSDRERGPRARTEETISERVWRAIYYLVQRRIDDGSFGASFPDMCVDGRGPFGTDAAAFWRTARAEIPDLPENIIADEVPDLLVILDLLEFCARSVAQPIQRDFHSYFGHYHLDFDRDAGLAEFVASVDRLFARNGVAFELTAEGIVRRLGPPTLGDTLRQAVFHTGDAVTDRLLEDARRRFLSPQTADRLDALEKLWDAFERIKTLEKGANKRAMATQLLDRAVHAQSPKFRAFLEIEAKALTDIGNSLRIRHSETDKEPVEASEQVDYLFHRLFSFLFLLLRRTRRAR